MRRSFGLCFAIVSCSTWALATEQAVAQEHATAKPAQPTKTVVAEKEDTTSLLEDGGLGL